MRYVKLGSTGLEVSVICLGGLNFGEPERGIQAWSIGEEETRPLLRHAVEAGITFFDTANVYSDGSSEEIMGRALGELLPRENLVIATKVHGRMHAGPNGGGLSRKAIFAELDASLRRLGTDYIDLYQPHRWDDTTPIEETMEAFHDAIKAGKVRYIGASSMSAWQFSKAQYTATLGGWTRFVSMQDHYNLLMREEEQEMHPLCEDLGVGVIPWSPMARGRLTRDPELRTARTESDQRTQSLYPEGDDEIIAAVARIAEAHGVSRAQVALAWVLSKPVVDAPIIGASKPLHIDDAVAALEVELSAEEIAELEAPYTPRVNSV